MLPEKIKKWSVRIVVLLVNLGLVGGGALYMKNKQDQKKAMEELAAKQAEVEAESELVPIVEEAPVEQAPTDNIEQKTDIAQENAPQAVEAKVAAPVIKKAAPVPEEKPKTTKKTPAPEPEKPKVSAPTPAPAPAPEPVKVAAPAPEPKKTTKKS